MATNYPGSLDSYARPNTTDPLDNPSHAGIEDNQYDAVEAVETELGTDPAGAQTDVKTRLLLMLQKGSSATDGVRTRDVNSINRFLNGNFKYFYHGTSGAGVDASSANCPEGWISYLTPSTIERVAGVKTDPLGVGSYIVKVTADGANEGIYIGAPPTWLKIKPSTTYTLSFWHRVDNASDIIELYLYDYEDTTLGTTHLNNVDISSTTSWALYTKTFTTANDADNARLITKVAASGDIMYLSGMSLVEGSAPFAYSPHPEDHLYEQQTKWINGAETHHSAGGVPNKDHQSGWPHTVNDTFYFHFPVLAKMAGKTTCIDAITIYLNTVSATGGEDFIDVVYLYANDLDGTETAEISHTDDLGNGSNGNENHQVVDTMYEMTDYPYFLAVSIQGTDAVGDVKVRGFEMLYHRKNHE